jgi:hypothetical protein
VPGKLYGEVMVNVGAMDDVLEGESDGVKVFVCIGAEVIAIVAGDMGDNAAGEIAAGVCGERGARMEIVLQFKNGKEERIISPDIKFFRDRVFTIALRKEIEHPAS